MKIYLLAFALILLMACNNNESKTEREGESTIYNLDNEDQEMNEAIQKANQTFSEFDKALKNDTANYNNFSVKVRFKTVKGGEHIWLGDIFLKDEKYFGIVDNLPAETREIGEGDTIEVDIKNISDWMYVDSGKLRGGYTIRVLRNRMSDVEKKQFDEEYGLIIEE